MNNFQEIFKTKSTRKLLEIVDSADDYSTEAVDAAKVEMAMRTDIEEAQKQLAELKENAERRAAQTERIETAFEEKVKSLIRLLNPFHPEIVGGARRLKMLVLFFGGISIYKFIREAPYFLFVWRDQSASFDMASVYFLFPIVVLPIGTYLLFKRRKTGWGILYAWSIANCLSAFVSAWYIWGYEPSGNPMFDGIFPQSSSGQLTIGGIIAGGIVVAFLNKAVRNQLGVCRKTMIIWTVMGVLMSGFGLL